MRASSEWLALRNTIFCEPLTSRLIEVVGAIINPPRATEGIMERYSETSCSLRPGNWDHDTVQKMVRRIRATRIEDKNIPSNKKRPRLTSQLLWRPHVWAKRPQDWGRIDDGYLATTDIGRGSPAWRWSDVLTEIEKRRFHLPSRAMSSG